MVTVIAPFKKTRKEVHDNPMDYQAGNKALQCCKAAARNAFAQVAAADHETKLAWSKYGQFLHRAEEIPHSKSYFQGICKDEKVAALVEKLVKEVQKATNLSYVV